jgi:CDP-diacylglycerol--glycerol-3-phosphate 3-phosphatidyltransferase
VEPLNSNSPQGLGPKSQISENLDQTELHHDQSHSDAWDIDNLPNRITLFRILLIPVIIACLYLQKSDWTLFSQYQNAIGWIGAWTFVLASITDYVDGHIARKRKIITVFGSFLDPIADKFLTVSALIMLLFLERIPVLIVVILVLREFYMTSLRLLASTEDLKVPVDSLGKWKTATLMIGLPMLMANNKWWIIPFPLIGGIFLYVASILSIYSSINYSIGLIKKLKQLRIERRLQRKAQAHLEKNLI